MFKEAGLININLKLMEKQEELGEQHRKTLLIYGEKK
jgi:hypothetical protein